jgi:hypothetical protein
MQQRMRLSGLAWLHVMGTVVLVLSVLAAGLVAPAPAWAQDAGDPAPDNSAEIVGPPGPVEPVLPVEPAAWDGPIETLEYVAPDNPVDGVSEAAVWAGKTTRVSVRSDTFIASGDPTDNFGGASTMQLGWPNSRFQASRILIRFDIGPLPNKAKIYNARLFMYLDSGLPAGGPTMRLNGALATRGWDEGSATWNNARDIGGGQWHLGDVSVQPGWKNFGLTSQVQSWVNGQSNNGMVIIGYEVSPYGRVFRSRHFGGSEPYLEVNYECDTLPPVTRVNSLPATSPGSFTVTWGGRDQAPSGCQPTGIRKFSVQYRINGGAWVDWKSTTGTSATFDNFAPNDAVVDFRVRADDNAGNVERFPSSPQASTRVISQAPVVTMTPLPAITNAASFTINWLATSAPGGIASYDVQWQVNNGAWMDLMMGTTQTSYTVTGAQSEFTYGFRARGRDRLGNAGNFPASPQAQTTVVLFPIAKMVPFNPAIINSSSPVTTSFPMFWTGNTPPGTTITQYQIHYRVRDLTGVELQPWTVWQTFPGTITSATFPVALGNGVYDFEATATNNLGQTTPFVGKAEATMVVDLGDTIKPKLFLPQASHR